MARRPSASNSAIAVPGTRLADIARLAATDHAGATKLALAAQASGVADALTHHLVALHLRGKGQVEEAIEELSSGLALDPHNPALMTTFGFCLLDLDRRQEAARVFETALKLEPNSAQASYGYGWTAERLGALEQAQAAWERAVALAPDHADALAGLSGLAVRRRDWTKARDYAERAAGLDERQTDALMNLARVAMGLGYHAEAEERLRALLGHPHLPARARPDVEIMLGDALDGQKRYAEAFEAYVEGKSSQRAIHAGTFERPGVASAIESANRILSDFQATRTEAWVKPATEVAWRQHAGHAFLLGFPRSGTTLLEQVLATHPDIVTLEERPALLMSEIEFLAKPGGVERLADIVDSALDPFRDDYWRRVKALGVDVAGKTFVDKQPLHTFRLPLIFKQFPEARIIFALRDPRDVVLSCFRRNFNMNASMYQFCTLDGAARYYAAVMEAGMAYVDALPMAVSMFRYEDMVRNFDGRVAGLCDFLDVDFTPDLHNFADAARSRAIATPSSTQVGRGLYEEGIDQWRRYDFALRGVMPILAPWIERFGYSAD